MTGKMRENFYNSTIINTLRQAKSALVHTLKSDLVTFELLTTYVLGIWRGKDAIWVSIEGCNLKRQSPHLKGIILPVGYELPMCPQPCPFTCRCIMYLPKVCPLVYSLVFPGASLMQHYFLWQWCRYHMSQSTLLLKH